MDEVGSSTIEAEEEPSPSVALDEETRAKLLKLLRLKVPQARKGATSTCVGEMLLLDQMHLRRLK